MIFISKEKTLLTILFCLFLQPIFSFNNPVQPKLIPEIKSVKNGILFGLQMGKYTAFELGGEKQWKKIKLKEAETKALNAVFEYQFKSNTIGLKAGGWYKTGRLSFTYGGAVTFLSNFDYTRWGISPQIGYRILNFHGYLSYNITAGPKLYSEFNKLHVAVRFYLNKNREIEVEKKKKK